MTDLRRRNGSSPRWIRTTRQLSKDNDCGCNFPESCFTYSDEHADKDLTKINHDSTAVVSTVHPPADILGCGMKCETTGNPTINSCTCQYPLERFDSIVKPQERPSLDDVWFAENESDSSEAEKLKLIWEYAEKNKYLDPEKHVSSDGNISIWALRQSFENTSLSSCPEHDTIESDRAIQDHVDKHDRANFYAKDKVPDLTQVIVHDEKPVLENQKVSSLCHDSAKSDGNEASNSLGEIKQNCQWFSKTCEISDYSSKKIGDESSTEILPASTTNDQLQRNSRNENSEKGKIDKKLGDENTGYYSASLEPVTVQLDSSSCSITPDSLSSDSTQKQQNSCLPQDDTTSNEGSETGSKSSKSEGLQSLTRIFRRARFRNRAPSSSFCGYSLERDYCVDSKTDQIFKTFLKPDPKLFTNDAATCFRRPPSSRNESTQLRRQLMRKQYSDSVAVYYGQRMRRWRVKKQRSDSVNCPVDRVLRRQEHIEEEYYPNDATPQDDRVPNKL